MDHQDRVAACETQACDDVGKALGRAHDMQGWKSLDLGERLAGHGRAVVDEICWDEALRHNADREMIGRYAGELGNPTARRCQ